MILFYIIPSLIIVVSLILVIAMVIKKFPQVANINVGSIAKEKEGKVINRLITERLKRKVTSTLQAVKEVSQPIADVFGQGFNQLYQKVLELEKTITKKQPLKQIDINQTIKDKLVELQKLSADKDFIRAEDLAIEVIGLDEKNIEAYEYLVDVYVGLKDYKKARETGKFLAKLLGQAPQAESQIHRLANCYANLGMIYELEGKNSQSLKHHQKAVALEPNNPRFLDLLLKISIILENKPLAEEVFQSLKQADPDNGKLIELQEQIQTIKPAVPGTT